MHPVDQGCPSACPARLIQEEGVNGVALLPVRLRAGLARPGEGPAPQRRHRGVGAIDGLNEVVDVVGHGNFGAKLYLRVKKLTNVFIAGSTCLAGAFFIVIEVFSRRILSAFITNPDIVSSGLSNFRLMYCAFATYGLLIMVITYFQSLGKAKQAGFLVMLRQLVLVIPLVLTMPVLMGGNVLGVWLALPLNDVIILLVAIGLLIKEYKYLKEMAENSCYESTGEAS